MKEIIPNEQFQKNTTPSLVKLLNELGIKAVANENGFEYDFDSLVDYAKKTPKGLMPVWFTNFNNINLKWLLGSKYEELYYGR